MHHAFSCLAALALVGTAFAQSRPTMDFEKYDPVSSLVVPEHKVTRAKFPFIDVHNHQWNMLTQDLGSLTRQMDQLNMAIMVNLSGRSGAQLQQTTQRLKREAPSRLIIFAN